jgi:hypothetical protein
LKNYYHNFVNNFYISFFDSFGFDNFVDSYYCYYYKDIDNRKDDVDVIQIEVKLNKDNLLADYIVGIFFDHESSYEEHVLFSAWHQEYHQL